MSRTSRFSVAAVAAWTAAALAPGSALAAIGDQLDKFVPSPSGDGRGIEVASQTSSTAWYTNTYSEDSIYRVDLKTHASADTLNTDLENTVTGRSFGALAWDQGQGVLWGSEYQGGEGWIDRINPTTGVVTRVFSAAGVVAGLDHIDGLVVDSDGSLWMSADGLGLANTDIHHFSNTGTHLGGGFNVPIANSGMILDGDNFWLADIDNKRIHQYTKAGAATGTTFPVAADVAPEDLAFDYCSFTGKKALWVNSAAFGGGPMAAYEIGASTNAGCPTVAPPNTPPNPNIPDKIKIGGPKKKRPVAGRPIWYDVTNPVTDPRGTVYIYIWIFYDYRYIIEKPRKEPTLRPEKQDKGKVKHTYKCAGFYAPKVTVIDENGVRKEISTNATVSFSNKDVKRHGGLNISPRVTSKGSMASFRLTAQRSSRARGGRTKVIRAAYKLDGRKIGTARSARKAVRSRIKRNGPHRLDIDARFKGPRGKKKIKTCFQLPDLQASQLEERGEREEAGESESEEEGYEIRAAGG